MVDTSGLLKRRACVSMRTSSGALLLPAHALLAAVLITSVLSSGCSDPSAAGEPVSVSIDISAPRAAIDDKVFGLFIEHQGRCIYGGIWAEMLKDRKFYYPIRGSFTPYQYRSPWEPSGDGEEIYMDTASSYVGQYAAKIMLDKGGLGGIHQGKLGLKKGKAYAGYVVVAAAPGVEVQVALAWGDGDTARQVKVLNGVTSSYQKITFELTSGGDTSDGKLFIKGKGPGQFRIGAASLMPADNVNGLRADVLKLLKELNPPVIRWPGGAFADYYDWKDGIGERDLRVPREIWAYDRPALESNDFGLHEFMLLTKTLAAQPYFVLRARTEADAAAAAQAVEYCNGQPSTTMGILRAQNGHSAPFKVPLWGIGNESYSFMRVETFYKLHQKLAAAMRAVDPTIKLVGVGGLGISGLSSQSDWTQSMLSTSSAQMDFIGEHVYGQGSKDLRTHANAIRKDILRFLAQHRKIRKSWPPSKKQVRLAFDEWNYIWFGRTEYYGEAGVRYDQSHALGIAAALQTLLDASDLVGMANAHPVNVHGLIKTNATDAALETTGLVLKLYRARYGKFPLGVSGDIGEDLDPVGVAAALTADRATLTIGVVNPSKTSYQLVTTLKGGTPGAGGKRWTIASNNPLAFNEPGAPAAVSIEESDVDGAGGLLPVPPLSVNIFRLPLTPP